LARDTSQVSEIFALSESPRTVTLSCAPRRNDRRGKASLLVSDLAASTELANR